MKIIKEVLILLRYMLLLVITLLYALFPAVYNLMLYLTIYPTNLLINLFYSSYILNNSIITEHVIIKIIPACVAVSAYFLLLILNLTTDMKARQRIYSLVFSFIALLLINILRIFLLSILLITQFVYFDIVHKFFWYVLSILIVIGIWFLSVYLFKIKNIPVYTNINYLIKKIKRKK